MKVRVSCQSCNKGLAGNTNDKDYGNKVIQFMIGHMTDYKILAAHKDPYHGGNIRPIFAIDVEVIGNPINHK